MSVIRISELWLYPIKGCGGISVPSIELTSQGPKWDRHWMIIDQEGDFQSQRQLPLMCQIGLEWNSDKGFNLDIPGRESFLLRPLSGGDSGNVSILRARVWDSEVQVVETDPQISAAISDFLGERLRLVEMAPGYIRSIKEKYGAGQIQFADSLPFLVISQESLDGLNRRLSEPVPMNRFRPNLVVQGVGEAHREDQWRRVRIGDVEYTAPKLCVRCVVTTIDQSNGQRSPEPLSTLAQYRRGEKGILFGQHLVPQSQGVLHRGDEVEIMEFEAL